MLSKKLERNGRPMPSEELNNWLPAARPTPRNENKTPRNGQKTQNEKQNKKQPARRRKKQKNHPTKQLSS